MSKIIDPNMDTAIAWANLIGPPPRLPSSMVPVEQRAKLVHRVDSLLVAGSLLDELSLEERKHRLNQVAESGTIFFTRYKSERRDKEPDSSTLGWMYLSGKSNCVLNYGWA